MSRRQSSSSPESSPRLAKRPRLDFEPLTKEDYKNGIVLAPMVRSGSLPTRLYALKHGATLVWGPETVDKAILHATREVDPETGVVSYNGKTKAIFTTHPIEKPYLIYQIGSADPATAVAAAQTVLQDVAGFDLNCGCPKPFSTHAGMGAALLTNPDLLCAILSALRAAVPPTIPISAKIRLLPSQADTLRLVERIVRTGVSCLTVHCRTRSMRQREPALVHRLGEIVQFVDALGAGIAVVENGDCAGYAHALEIRKSTGAHSVMIATAAEANPTVFSPTPLADLELTFIPAYLRLGRFLGNHWANTKFCALQFKGAHVGASRADLKAVRDTLARAKAYDDVEALAAPWARAEEEFAEIVRAVEARGARRRVPAFPPNAPFGDSREGQEAGREGGEAGKENAAAEDGGGGSPSLSLSPLDGLKTPLGGGVDPAILRAPLAPANELRMPLPAYVTGEDVPTPSPTPALP